MSRYVFSWGSNKSGELGINNFPDKKNCGDPQQITVNGSPVSVASGEGHSLILMDNGDVYAFGRGREGQLGLCSARSNQSHPHLIMSLQNEYITSISCGAMTSYAITSSGSIYQWGLIQRNLDNQGNVESSAAAGELTGLAEDQSRSIAVDVESRQSRHYSADYVHSGASRQLRDIVSESTERWLLANDEADLEYLSELRALGYQNEELEQREQDRGTEYHGMLRVGCHRYMQLLPQRITKLSHLRVASIAAGYAHCILLTDTGHLYSSGYNDRGQLGIGHRISTAEFTLIDKLDNKFVIQITCGQQHNLCRCIDRDSAMKHDVRVGSDVGADVFAWGNGVLGQLGMGRRGTSKGRLSPTLLPDLYKHFPRGIIDVGAGANFSVAVTDRGQVLSWGHSEYNQHGTGGIATTDYTDPYYYFTPREVDVPTAVNDPVVKVSCGSNFTIATTSTGEMYSWGWGAYGTLGRGGRHVSSTPDRVTALGLRSSEYQVLTVAAGTNHVLAVVSSPNSDWAAGNSVLLDSIEYADAQIEIEGESVPVYCHRVILSARSNYFRGYLRTAMDDPQSALTVSFQPKSESGEEAEAVSRQVTRIQLTSPAANSTTVRGLLEYLYTDTCTIPKHKSKQLEELALDLGLTRLAVLANRKRVHHGVSYSHHEGIPALSPSTYVFDLAAAVGSEDYADVVFQTEMTLPNGSFDEVKSCDGDANGGVFEPYSSLPQIRVTYGHKCMLSRMLYFRSLFSSKFKENASTMDIACGRMVLSLEGFIADGIDFQSFKNVLYYAYTGSIDLPIVGYDDSMEEGKDYMSMLAAGNRLGLPSLAQLCEQQLYSHLTDFPENIDNCATFAKLYDLSRLDKLCQELQASGKSERSAYR